MANPGSPTSDARIEMVELSKLQPSGRNARRHPKKQIRQIADSIRRFGFINPLIIDEDGNIVAGHGRYAAAALLQTATVPVHYLMRLMIDGRSPTAKRVYTAEPK
jgi:hypothetical protein